MRNLNLLFILILAALLSGCSYTPVMELPPHPRHSPPQLTDKSLSSVTFEKGIAAIKRGTIIANYPSNRMGLNVPYCNSTYPSGSYEEWDSGTKFMSGWDGELAQVFYDTMKGLGHKVAGDPSAAYEGFKEHLSADYSVTARILEIMGNLCESHDRWNKLPQKTFAGEFHIRVEWVVYDTVTREVVLTVETEGYKKRMDPLRQGMMKIFLDAFASAAEGLASDENYLKLISGGDREGLREGEEKKFPEMEVEGARSNGKELEQGISSVIPGVVTIRHGDSHGSGFVIGEKGFVITCRHVVGSAGRVAVVFSNGMEVAGTVLRSSKFRDVALIKVDAAGLTPLPVNLAQEVKLLDAVYAIGAPIKVDLKETVTKGIVSAFRKGEKDGLDYIQSDVGISAGNSGGPLLDKNGNVIGIAVSHVSKDEYSSGLNLFIPIADALRFLNVKIVY